MKESTPDQINLSDIQSSALIDENLPVEMPAVIDLGKQDKRIIGEEQIEAEARAERAVKGVDPEPLDVEVAAGVEIVDQSLSRKALSQNELPHKTLGQAAAETMGVATDPDKQARIAALAERFKNADQQ